MEDEIINSVITIVGSINYDLVTYISSIPDAGETKQSNSFETHFGGKGLNQAISTSKLIPRLEKTRIKIQMCGNVGDDSFGMDLEKYLVKNTINIENVKNLTGTNTGVAVIIVEEDSNGENRILITPGANAKTLPTNEEYEKLFNITDKDIKQYVILQNETPNTVETINWLHTNRPNINIIYNPSPFIDLPSEIYKKIDVLVVNETEALMSANDMLKDEKLRDFKEEIAKDKISGFHKLATTLRQLINLDKLNLVIITLGSTGSLYSSKESGDDLKFFKSNKIPKDKVKDTTGAGDTFLGAIVSQLSLGNSIDSAMKFAIYASSLTVQKKGAAETIPVYEDVAKLLKD
ncbi:hypothetical protein PACTADRAFT_36415 [Pachysolen tannophilus NRRL Y-2460]|uniref:Ribokinase n=1 Tax=Pachysolen tannophilus NRRL Y-2460 TaxID=669874 RepID=A0A1E4U3H8_PACTA|nr:hypothetical protein PACTADRAFT_36415 [Pachysolen tannophilus NRRL Y-2460]